MEALDKGLHSAADSITLPPGALVRARNARYKAGDPAVWQSEGRMLLGAAGDHRATDVFGAQLNVYTDAEEDRTALNQLILFRRANDSTKIFGLPAPDTPELANDEVLTVANIVTPISGSTQTSDLGPLPIDTVIVNNQLYLLHGAKPSVLWQSFSAGIFQQAGFEETDGPLWADPVGASGDFFYYWYTWYNSSTNQESAAGDVAVFGRGATSRALKVVDSFWKPPAHATHVRVYRAKGQTARYPVPFPVGGWRILETTLPITPSAGFVTLGTDTFAYPDSTIEFDHLGAPLGNYQFTSVRVGTQEASVSRDSPLPRASTGDVYEESLVCDDLDNLGVLAYTPASLPASCPSIFRIAVPGVKQIDPVRAIRAVGSRLVCWLGNAIWRINWLPRESDFDFSAGRVKDLVSPDKGTFSHQSVCLFTLPGGQALAAFLDRTGLYATDAYSTIKLAEQIDWTSLLAGITNPRLVNNSEAERLELSVGSDLYYFHYDEAHFEKTENGIKLAVTGPIERPHGIAGLCEVQTEGGRQLIASLSTDGNIHYEGFSFKDALTELQFSIESREWYPFGPSTEGVCESFWAHFRPASGGGSTIVRLNTFTKQSSRERSSPPIPLGTRRLVERTSQLRFESVSVEVEGSAVGETGMAVNGFGIHPESPSIAQRS